MATDQRWDGIERPYDAATFDELRGSLPVEHTLADTPTPTSRARCSSSPAATASTA
jgi:isocitrate lyase